VRPHCSSLPSRSNTALHLLQPLNDAVCGFVDVIVPTDASTVHNIANDN
jgi:hypothetical protein